MKLLKDPLWPMKAWTVFAIDDDLDAGGGGGGDDNDTHDTPAAKPSAHWVGEDKDLQGYVDKKGYKDPASVTSAYRELEKKFGGMTTVPDAKATDDDWEKFAGKLRPRNVGEYADVAPEGLPEDIYDENLSTAMKQAAFDIGIPPKMFSRLWGQYWQSVGDQVKGLDNKATEIKTQDEKTMRVKWGNDYDANTKLADRTLEKTGLKDLFKQFGIDSHPLVLSVFHHLSQHMEEMQPPGAKGGEPEDKPQWFTDYKGVG